MYIYICLSQYGSLLNQYYVIRAALAKIIPSLNDVIPFKPWKSHQFPFLYPLAFHLLLGDIIYRWFHLKSAANSNGRSSKLLNEILSILSAQKVA